MLSVLLVSLSMVSADTLFEDNFESATIDGAKWTQAGDPEITSTGSYVNHGSYAVLLDGGVNPDDLVMSVTIDTTNYKNIELSYSRLLESLESDNGFVAKYSVDSGGSWTELENVYGTEAYSDKSYVLSPSADNLPGLMIRFSVYGGATNDLAALDDVLVTGDESVDPVISLMNAEPPYPTCNSDVEVCATVTDDSAIDFVAISCVAGTLTITDSNVPLINGKYCIIISDTSNGKISDSDTLVCTVTAEDIHENNAVQNLPNPLATYDCADPVADASNNEPHSCNEGSSVTLDASLSTDSASGIAQWLWDFDNDGFYDDASGETTSYSCLDGPANPTIGLKVIDNVGLEDTDTTTITVLNLNPWDVDAHGPYPVNEGASISLSGSATDVAADTPLAEYAWDLTGSSSYTTIEQNPSFFCAQDGTYTVNLRVTDKDGGMEYDTATVNCANVAPVINSLGVSPNPINEEESTTFTATVSDVGIDDNPLDYTINWGDGSSDSTGTTTGAISVAHQYMDDDGDDMYTITLTVKDSDHATDVETTTITVLNLDPLDLAITVDQTPEVKGEPVCFEGFATDVSADTLTLTYDWTFGDGNIATSDQTPCNTYDDNGIYTVTLTVEDDDGGSATDTLTVTVYDYIIPLDAGWNLISIPLVPEDDDTSVANVFDSVKDDVLIVWAYTYDAGQDKNVWTFHEVEGGVFDSSDSLQNIVPGYGYYVKMAEHEGPYYLYLNGEIDYQVGGEDNNPVMGMPPSVTLAMDSWNLIGIYGINDLNKNHALQSLENQDGDKYYDILYNEDGNHAGSTLHSLEGYWLSIKKAFAGSDTIQYKANYNTGS